MIVPSGRLINELCPALSPVSAPPAAARQTARPLDWVRRARQHRGSRYFAQALAKFGAEGGRHLPPVRLPGVLDPLAAYREVIKDQDFLARHPQTLGQLAGSCRGLGELPSKPEVGRRLELRDRTRSEGLAQDNSIHEYLASQLEGLETLAADEVLAFERTCERLGDWDGAAKFRLARIRAGEAWSLGQSFRRVEYRRCKSARFHAWQLQALLGRLRSRLGLLRQP
jgi:hypothetical protein